MIFRATTLRGAYIIEIEQKEDSRGFFARSYCSEEFRKKGIDFKVVQSNISYNRLKGTLRGMHFQKPPYEEKKLVSCVKGAVYDVVIDLRKDSETYLRWEGIELTENNYLSLFIPGGFAHGFQTLNDETVVHYQMSELHHQDHEGGVRWDDPVFGIEWPEAEKRIISEKDRMLPDFKGDEL